MSPTTQPRTREGKYDYKTHSAPELPPLTDPVTMSRYWADVSSDRARKSADPALLAQLATHPEWVVRWDVAQNPNTPSSLLDALAADTDVNVRVAVAGHPNTPAATLAAMAVGEDAAVQVAAAKNGSLPLPAQAQLAETGSQAARIALGTNPNLFASVRKLLLADPSKSVRSSATLRVPAA